MNNNKIVLDIPAMTIIKVVAVLAGIALLYVIRDVLVLFFIVLVLVTALSPIVDRWSKKMPRQLAVSIIYVIFLTLVAGAVVLIGKPLILQLQLLTQNIPELIAKVAPALKTYKDIGQLSQEGLSSLTSNITNFGSSIVSTTFSFLGGLVAIFTLMVLSFYLLLEEEGAKTFFKSIIPPGKKESVIEAINKISIKMGSWLRGQLTLIVLIGLLDLVGLLILGVPYALTLAVWAALTESIAYVGPILGAIPAIIIAYTVNPLLGILVIALFVLVQQIEAQFLVPKIMGKAVGLSPVIIILAILIGAKLFGVLGVVLAVPVAAIISVIYEEWPKLKGLD
ncbi:MAG: AI-2E family transporter [Patescibacteria group bacterium]|jgi:predicted PurR-regulated permease PerM